MNLFAQQWPSLLKVEGFLCTLLTPIVKAWPGGSAGKGPVVEFYNLTDYQRYLETFARPDRAISAPPIKYYKGLGTSTAEEARDWFRKMKMVVYVWEDAEGKSKEALGLAFDKKRADDRKAWLAGYDPTRTLDYGGGSGGASPPKPQPLLLKQQPQLQGTDVTFSDFVDKDLIHFSNYDVMRSIPSAVDGFKVSQRKAIFGCRKRNLVKGELRVAQLAAYVAEHACFHHGEASMQGTIVCLAQVNFL
jgi:DNA topoisomerase-2